MPSYFHFIAPAQRLASSSPTAERPRVQRVGLRSTPAQRQWVWVCPGAIPAFVVGTLPGIRCTHAWWAHHLEREMLSMKRSSNRIGSLSSHACDGT